MTLRSLALNVVLYISLVAYMLLALPTFFLPRRALMAYIRSWGRYFVWICRVIGGIGLEVRGRENIPPGPLLVASKHQSIWETFALIGLFDDPCFILKRELTWIPLFGQYALKSRMLPVDRRGGPAVLRQLNDKARDEIRHDRGRQILLFPEGTRRAAGAPPNYRHGISHIYERLGVPCLPIALNSGLFWPRRSLKHRKGTILVEILPPLPPDMPREEFAAVLQARIEEASDRLLAEGLAELGADAPVLPARAG